MVVASAKCSTAFLDKDTFEKYMGPVAEVLKRAIHKLKFEDLRPFKILGTGTFGNAYRMTLLDRAQGGACI